MAYSLDAIQDCDADFATRFLSNYLSDFAEAAVVSGAPKTGKALHMLFLKCLLIKDALFRQAEDEDAHTMMILYRSYIDHFLKHAYIYLRYRELGSDAIGEQYYDHCILKNELDSMHAREGSESLFSQAFAYPGTWDGADRLLSGPDKKPYDKRELERAVTQFYVPSIFQYISGAYSKGNMDIADADMYRQMLFGYIEYKSYAYGEPWTEEELFTMSEEDRRRRLVQDTCLLVYNSFCALMRTSYSFLMAIEPDRPDILEEIRRCRLI